MIPRTLRQREDFKKRIFFVHTSEDLEDTSRFIESALDILGVKYKRVVHSEKKIVYMGKGFRIRLLRRYYGTQIAISGRKARMIYDNIEVLLPKASLLGRAKEETSEEPLKKKITAEIAEESEDTEILRMKYLLSLTKLIYTGITLVFIVGFLIMSLIRGFTFGVIISVILQAVGICEIFMQHTYKKRKRGKVVVTFEYVPTKVFKYKRTLKAHKEQ